jgi:hypothetical protein
LIINLGGLIITFACQNILKIIFFSQSIANFSYSKFDKNLNLGLVFQNF